MVDAPPTFVGAAIERLGLAYVELAAARTGKLPVTDFDPQWPSPCVAGPAADGRCYWQPVAMAERPAFSRLAAAMERPVHDDLIQFYGTAWSASLPARFEGNDLELLQLWNDRDFENLLGNLIGHSLEKKRVRQPLTFFFALVDDDRFLSIDNQSGEVFLETLGLRRPLSVEASLPAFLARLEVVDR